MDIVQTSSSPTAAGLLEGRMITCSAGKGVLSARACLDCARTLGLPPCGGEYTLLSAIYNSAFDQDRSQEIHVTDLTKCIRKAYLDKIHKEAEMPHKMMAKIAGLAIHNHLEAKSLVGEAEMPVALDGVVGRVDVLYDGVLVDYKTVENIRIFNLPYGDHEVQLNLYAYMLRSMDREVNDLRLVYVSRSGPSKCRSKQCGAGTTMEMIDGEIRCPRCLKVVSGSHLGFVTVQVRRYSDEELEEVFQHRKNILQQAMAAGTLPQAEAGWICRYCTHECDEREE